jgi:mycofactocin precursor
MENAIVAVEEADQDDLVEEELLVEEISIDGMCGVY